MHPHHAIPHTLIVTALNPTQELNGNPLLLALHKCWHDLGNSVLAHRLGLYAVHILLISLAHLLLARLLGNCSVPAICIVNSQRFDRGIRQFGRSVRLGSSADETNTIRFTAITRLRIRPVAVDVVVEDQLFTRFDVTLGKNAHSELLAHDPLVDVTVGIARVVTETAQIPPLGRIDKFTLVQRHKIKVLDTIFIVEPHAATELRLGNDFSDVLEYELVRSQVGLGAEAVPFLFRLDDSNICIFSSLESLVLAIGATAAVTDAFNLGCAVDAV